MMNKFQFLVEGYEDVPDELYSIPEVRKSYQHLHRVWPYWHYFCDLRTDTLNMMTMCVLPTISSFKRLGQTQAEVQYKHTDLIRFVEKNFAPLNLMMERAGMSEMDNYNRTRDVFLYYQLPFDCEPPQEDC